MWDHLDTPTRLRHIFEFLKKLETKIMSAFDDLTAAVATLTTDVATLTTNTTNLTTAVIAEIQALRDALANGNTNAVEVAAQNIENLNKQIETGNAAIAAQTASLASSLPPAPTPAPSVSPTPSAPSSTPSASASSDASAPAPTTSAPASS